MCQGQLPARCKQGPYFPADEPPGMTTLGSVWGNVSCTQRQPNHCEQRLVPGRETRIVKEIPPNHSLALEGREVLDEPVCKLRWLSEAFCSSGVSHSLLWLHRRSG